MGMTGALKLRRVTDDLEMVLAIGLAAAQGLDFRDPLRPGRGVEEAYEKIRSVSTSLTEDRPLSRDIERVAGGRKGR